MRWMLGVVLCLWISGISASCEASVVSRAVGNVWSYFTFPAPCAMQWASKVGTATLELVYCVLTNANPQRLVP